jgi:maleamate amidohydrolase
MDESLRENYERAYGNRIVQAYFDPQCDLYAGVDNALASALRVRGVAHEAGVPVVLTRVAYQANGLDGGRFFEKARPLRNFLPGCSAGRWPEALTPRPDELVITKQYPSVFFGTSLASTLTAAGVDNVILTGLTTSGCVRASCVDAMSHGFITSVVREACGDRHPAPHEANLFDMNAKYADVVDEVEVIAFLRELRRCRKAEKQGSSSFLKKRTKKL